MKDRWNFTDDELSRVTQDRLSYFTFPIGRDGQYAQAVLYMDSPNPGTFTDLNKQEIADKIRQLFLPQLEQVLSS